MKVVVAVPLRLDERREPVWRWVRQWIADNYDFPVFTADSDSVVFSAGEARNNAVRLAGDWDVAVFHDADTIAHPAAVYEAVGLAGSSDQMVLAGDSHMYCDRSSSERIMASGVPAFARPASFDSRGIYERPSGGVVAISRATFEKAGGYIQSLEGWGYEDLCLLQQCNLFAGGHSWVPGHITLHLWHPPALRTTNTSRNQRAWKMLANYRRLGNVRGARQYLEGLGHCLP